MPRKESTALVQENETKEAEAPPDVPPKKPKTKRRRKVSARDSRNLRLEWVDPRTLTPNPKNWRRHPQMQMNALSSVLDDVGWAGALLFNEKTGQLIDGHARRDLPNVKEVPVLIGNWTPEQEAEIIATLDPIAYLAETSSRTLAELINEVDTRATSRGVRDVLDEMVAENEEVMAELEAIRKKEMEDSYKEIELPPDDLTQAPIETVPLIDLREDAIFESSNSYGFPDLREDMLADTWPTNVWAGEDVIADPENWMFIFGKGAYQRENVEGGCLSFFANDEEFETVWNDAINIAQKFAGMGWGSVIAPDFSMYGGWPKVLQMWSTYRSRWCARLWQEVGIKVMPELNWSDVPSLEWAFDGIPRGCPVVACQTRTMGQTNEEKKQERGMWVAGFTRALEVVAPDNVVIYGGKEHRKWVEPNLPPKAPNIIWLDSWTGKRRQAGFRVPGARW